MGGTEASIFNEPQETVLKAINAIPDDTRKAHLRGLFEQYFAGLKAFEKVHLSNGGVTAVAVTVTQGPVNVPQALGPASVPQNVQIPFKAKSAAKAFEAFSKELSTLSLDSSFQIQTVIYLGEDKPPLSTPVANVANMAVFKQTMEALKK